jgi:two-component sensor histidine kinase
LQIISSLLNLQSENIKDKNTLDMFKKSQNRIKSMALVHEKSYQSKELARIDFAEYTQSLTNSLLRSYEINPEEILVELNIGDCLMDIDRTVPCGLIINELVSNSLVYAFDFSQDKAEDNKGRININLSTDDDNITLIVRDNGIGFPKDLDFRNTETLGMQLVDALINQLKGTIELNSNGGTEFKITFKA